MELPLQSDNSQPCASVNQCTFCQRTFARHEHLTRHVRSHTRERPFGCPTCGKHFARQDILSRHNASHRLEVGAFKPQASRRACLECAASRSRCSRDTPCKRCSQRNLLCRYPLLRKRRASIGHGEQTDDAADRATGPGIMQQTSIYSQSSEDNGVLQCVSEAAAVDPMLEDNNLAPLQDTNSMPAVSWGGEWINGFNMAHLNSNPAQDSHGINALQSFDVARNIAPALSSTNWMSPDDDMIRDWDLQLASLYNPAVSGTSVVPFIPAALLPVYHESGPWDSRLEGAPRLTGAEASVTRWEQDSAGFPQEQHVSVSECSGTDAVSTISTSSKYYVGGAGARAPFKGLSHERRSKADIPALSDVHFSTASTQDKPETMGLDMVSSHVYDDLLRRLHLEREEHSLGIDLASFPPLSHIAVFVKLYFDKFHPVFPFLDKTHFVQKRPHWVLLLAVATVGARYSGRQGFSQKQDLFHLLRVILHHRLHATPLEEETGGLMQSAEDEEKANSHIASIQAAVLSCICMFHSGKPGLMKQAAFERSYLVETANALHLFCPPDVRADNFAVVDNAQLVRLWLQAQSAIRTGFMIWLVDFVIAYESNFKPLMQIVDASAPLPCPEDIWESPSAEKILAYESFSVTLPETLEVLYIEKKLPPRVSEFATTLLIQAICRKTREAYCHSQTQLSEWTPSAKTQTRVEDYRVDESWPPATALLSNWRNSACDCLDVLHWAANGKAAQSAGWEHATILHLHIARLILLTPTTHFEALIPRASASTGTGGASSTEDAKQIKARSHVTQWAIRDQFKARLAVIHAGALFWHIRRYSIDCVVEPYGIYMATLVVWGYSVAVQSVRRQRKGGGQASTDNTSQSSEKSPVVIPGEGSPEECDSDPEPMFIHLDRPCDDEMVQTFVRSGHKMTGYMLRVGNICGKNAPSKILLEGLRLLVGTSSLGGREASADGRLEDDTDDPDTWGIERTYAESLRRLLKATSFTW